MARDRLTRFFLESILTVAVLAGASRQLDDFPVWEVFDSCDIPNEPEKGVCVIPQNCSAFHNLTKGEELGSVGRLGFVRALQCESSDETKVCCPQGGDYKDPQLLTDVPQLTRNPRPQVLLRFDSHDSCGQQEAFQDKILGTMTEIDEFPWAALLFYRNYHQGCGGVLISRTFVMTAAHCLAGPKYGQIGPLEFVRLREYNTLSNPDCTLVRTESGKALDCNEEKIDARPKSIKVHPSYDPNSFQQYNDIGLIEINQAVEYSDFLQSICLPNAGLHVELAKQKSFEVCGWGRTNFFDKQVDSKSPIKMKARLPFVKAEDCNMAYGSQQLDLGPGQICAGGRLGADSCAGDSGSPLMFFDEVNEIWILSGIVSRGPAACGEFNKPGIYTNVEYYLPWILQNVDI